MSFIDKRLGYSNSRETAIDARKHNIDAMRARLRDLLKAKGIDPARAGGNLVSSMGVRDVQAHIARIAGSK